MRGKYKNRFVKVDDSDFEYLNQWKWYYNQVNYDSKSKNGYGYRTLGRGLDRGTHLYMHRLIMQPPKNMVIDHINGDGLDNRRKNLRIITKEQNCLIRSKRYNSTNAYKGITKISGNNKFIARVGFAGKQHYLGTFNSALIAHRAYLKKAKELHGEFAR